MKRLLLFLMIGFLLTGCTVEHPPQTTESTPVQTELPGLYVPESRVEKETDNAVRVYSLGDGGYSELYNLGKNLLLVTDGKMLTITGDNGVPTASLTDGLTGVVGVDTTVTGLGYYRPDTREVVICNPQLQVVTQVEMPEDMAGEPVISMAQNQVFYATDTQIRAIDLVSGISRLIRTQSVPGSIDLQCHFDGSVLACGIMDEDGRIRTEYISSQTGQSYSEDDRISGLQSWQEWFFADYTDGEENFLIYGSLEGQTQTIQLPQPAGSVYPVLNMNGLLSVQESENGFAVSFFELEQGKRIAEVTVSGLQSPTAFLCDGTYIWLLAMDGEQQVLCRWDITRSAIRDSNIYTCPLYTAQNPDIRGLTACRAVADRIERVYGIEITFWTEAEKNAGGYAVVPEHSTGRIESALEVLRQNLDLLPKDFVRQTVGDGKLTVSLVRSVEERECAQFWKDGDCFLLIPTEDIPWNFFCALAYAMDSYVLGNSRDLDVWEELNPRDFEYTYSYEAVEQPDYLEGENRAFVDMYAMTYPHEDRCRTFSYAILPENAAVFASGTMQAKLKRLCLGIREAYGLEKSSQNYLWEQYLETPLAYVEK